MFEFSLISTQIQSYFIVKEEKVFGPLVSCGIMLTFSKATKDTVQIELRSTHVNKCKFFLHCIAHSKTIKIHLTHQTHHPSSTMDTQFNYFRSNHFNMVPFCSSISQSNNSKYY